MNFHFQTRRHMLACCGNRTADFTQLKVLIYIIKEMKIQLSVSNYQHLINFIL